LWLALILVFVLPKSNRNRRALLIIAPLVVVNLLWLLFKKAMGMPSSAAQQFDMLFQSISISIAVMWLIVHKLGNRNRFVTFLRALALMAVIGLVGAISYFGPNFSQQTIGAIIMLTISAFVILLGFVLAGRRCRIRYSGLRFMLYLALWTVAVCLACTLVFYSVTFSIVQVTVPISTILLLALVVGLIFGACLYVINLPFMILAFYSPFFRERFFACLRLKSMPTIEAQSNTRLPNEQ
jgi:peptidoglycan/LPS O-acetylase OafA/YrhL